jgi:hypothetical protein
LKIKWGDIKSVIAKVVNLTSNDSRVIAYANRAQERLLYEGKFVDTTVRYQVCVSEKCLVWPRQLETIEAIFMCREPLTIRGQWYESLENGPGLADSNSCGPCLTMIDRGSTVSFDWVTATGYKLAIYADGAESAGTVLVRYYDSSGNKVYTSYGGEIIEGERLTIPAAGGYTTATYEILPYGLYHVEKPVTNRVIRLYAQKISDNTLIPLAYYEPDETIPVYRASYLSELESQDSCGTTQVTVIAKLRFIPAINDSSLMMISHVDAIRLGVQAVKSEEDNLPEQAVMYWGLAIKCLNDQLRHHRGGGQVDPIRFVGTQTWGGGVINII